VTGRAPSAGALFRDELLAVLSPEARRGVLGVLRRWGGATVYLPAPSAAERQRRRDTAALLVRSGMTTTEAVAVLRQRFGISDRHARRLVTPGQFSKRNVRSATDTERS
jgi:Mor family transcriptional regulator